MPRFLAFGLRLAVLAAALDTPAIAQELPGVPSGTLPPALRNPYEEGVPKAVAPEPPQILVIPIPLHREPPRLVLVPDIRLSSGYSDNLFITPDIFGFRPVSDGLVSLSPRLRALFRLSRDWGVVGDYTLSYTQFFSHGNSLQNGGTLFLGYRPTVAAHAEFGLRGGTAQVSEFSASNFDEGHLFLSGSIPLTPFAGFAGSASVGLRDFPDRTRAESRALAIGIGPIVLPVPGSTTTVEKGQEDVVTNVAGGLSFVYARTGVAHAAYDYTDNDSDIRELRYQSHRVSMAGVNQWTTWLSTQLGYSVSFRRFVHAASDVSSVERRDTIQDLTAGVSFAPRYFADLRFARSGAIRIDYDWLLDRSNLSSGEFHRNFISVALEIGFLPLTAEQIGRRLFPGLYGMPASRSTSSSGSS